MNVESNWDLFHKARWNMFLKSINDTELNIKPLVVAIFKEATFLGVDYKKSKVVIDGAFVISKFFQDALEEQKHIWINNLIKCFPECDDLFIASPERK